MIPNLYYKLYGRLTTVYTRMEYYTGSESCSKNFTPEPTHFSIFLVFLMSFIRLSLIYWERNFILLKLLTTLWFVPTWDSQVFVLIEFLTIKINFNPWADAYPWTDLCWWHQHEISKINFSAQRNDKDLIIFLFQYFILDLNIYLNLREIIFIKTNENKLWTSVSFEK